MKIVLILLIVAFSTNQLIAQNPVQRIELNEVDPPEGPLETTSYFEAISKRIKIVPESYDISKSKDSLIATNMHPMVAALHYSFAQHRPIVISPDMIWLMICQSFAIHIDQNPEKFRDQLVNFDGKKKIIITRNDFIKGEISNPWSATFPVFSDSIRSYIGDSIHNILVPNFSTTTKLEKAAFEISLMDITSGYFEYEYQTFCGIPYVILEGNPEDWEWILNHLDFFNSFELDFWTKRLKSILHEIHQSSLGKHNIQFWNSIYKWNGGSGGDRVNGWITDFFLYINLKSEYSINKLLTFNMDSLRMTYPNRENQFGLRGNVFPTGLSKVDFKWIHIIEPIDTFEMSLYSGFIGIKQTDTTFLIKPEIGYAIVDQSKEKLQSPNTTIIDNGLGSCNPEHYFENKVYLFPIFNPKSNNVNYRKSEESFKKFLTDRLKETFAGQEENKRITVSLYIDNTGEVYEVEIGSSIKQEIKVYLRKLILETQNWNPAVINGKKEKYEYILNLYF